MSDRSPALERLDAFIGEWKVEAEIPGIESEPALTVFEWILDGQYLLERSEIPHPAAPDGFIVIALNEDGQSYTQHYFDSRGISRLYAMTFDGTEWKLTRDEADFSPLPFRQRFNGRLSDDGNTITGAWERTEEDGSWIVDFELTYTKVA